MTAKKIRKHDCEEFTFVKTVTFEEDIIIIKRCQVCRKYSFSILPNIDDERNTSKKKKRRKK